MPPVIILGGTDVHDLVVVEILIFNIHLRIYLQNSLDGNADDMIRNKITPNSYYICIVISFVEKTWQIAYNKFRITFI